MISFGISVEANRKRIIPAHRLVETGCAFSERGVVGLKDGSVVAEFGEVISAEEDSSIVRKLAADAGIDSRVLDIGFPVDRPAIGKGDQKEAVGAKHLGAG